MPTYRIRKAAGLLGVSAGTLRRWADGGRIQTITDASGLLAVDAVALARLAQDPAEPADWGRTGWWWLIRRGTGSAAWSAELSATP